jgi:hypothetical protein
MSRGPGKWQRALFTTIQLHGKPMTFQEIRAQIRKAREVEHYSAFEWSLLYSSFERSLRRALHGMVKNGALIAIGSGGRGDPFRYSIDPMMMALIGTGEEFTALMDELKADPGALQALNKRHAKRG